MSNEQHKNITQDARAGNGLDGCSNQTYILGFNIEVNEKQGSGNR